MPNDLLVHCAQYETLLAKVFEHGVVLQTRAAIRRLCCRFQYLTKVLMNFKKSLRNFFQYFGYDVLSLSYSQDYIYDRYLKTSLKRHDISTVLDIGGNIGGYGELLRSIGFAGQIHSYEPCTAPFEKLVRAASNDSKWSAHKLGLSDKVGQAEINIMAGSELNSLLNPAESSERMSVVGSELISLTSLDALDIRTDWSKTFVKIDTQGHDRAVIDGGLARLKTVPLLQTEISFLPIYKGMPSFHESLSLLDDIGFDVLGMFPISRDDAGRVREFDCLCLNRSFVG